MFAEKSAVVQLNATPDARVETFRNLISTQLEDNHFRFIDGSRFTSAEQAVSAEPMPTRSDIRIEFAEFLKPLITKGVEFDEKRFDAEINNFARNNPRIHPLEIRGALMQAFDQYEAAFKVAPVAEPVLVMPTLRKDASGVELMTDVKLAPRGQAA